METGNNIKPFASAHRRAQMVAGALAAIIVINLVNSILDYRELDFAQKMQQHLPIDAAEVSQLDIIMRTVGEAQIIVYAATAALFLAWVHRVHRNLPALGAQNLKYSPASAVWWWFVPFANLFRPYLAVEEVWHASDPGYEPGDDSWRQSPRSLLFTYWWIAFAFSGVVGRFLALAYTQAETLDQIIAATRAMLATDTFEVFVALLAILLVKRIDDRQEARSKRLQLEEVRPDRLPAKKLAA